MFGMRQLWPTRFRHFDRLRGDAASAELFGVRRFMSCDSVRRNFASIPAEEAMPWVWRENLRLLQDVVAEDYVLDLDPTVKPLYGCQEGAELGYSPQKPGRPSHCYHTLCIAELRMALAVVVHPGDETAGAHSRSMLSEYLAFVSAVRKPCLVRGDVSFGNDSVTCDCENVFDEMKNRWGWGGFTVRSLAQTALFAGLSVIAANLWNVFTRLCDDGTHREAATSRPLLQSCVARISRHARQGVITIYTAANEKAQGIYRAISAFLAKVASASQLGVEQRRQLIVAYALRKYGIVRRLFPPLIGRQATLPLC